MTIATYTNAAAGATEVNLISEPTTLYGFTALETGGAASSTVILRDGQDDETGPIVAAVTLAAGAAATVSFAVPVQANSGIRLERQGTGTAEVTAFHESD